MNSNQKNDDFLVASGLMISGFLLEKQDFRGRIIRQFDLREIPEIIVGKQRAFGCMAIAIFGMYLGIVLAWAFFDPETGLALALFIGGCGMFGLWFLKDTHHYYITFYYRNRSILFPLNDSEEKIERFLAQIRDSIRSTNSQLIIRNLLTHDEQEEFDDEDDDE